MQNPYFLSDLNQKLILFPVGYETLHYIDDTLL